MKPVKFFSARKLSLKLLFTIALFVLCSLSFLLIKKISNMGQAAYWVNHTTEVRLALAETLSMLKDAEADQRGFLLSKDSSFLNNCNLWRASISQHTDKLRTLVSDNPVQLKQVDTLQSLVTKRLDLLQTIRTDYGKNSVPAGLDFRGALLAGKQAMDAVKRRLSLMENIEQQLLHQRITQNNRFVVTTPFYALLLTTVALLIILFVFYKLGRLLTLSDRQSQLAGREAQKAGSLLENAERMANMASWEWNLSTSHVERSGNLYLLFGCESDYLTKGNPDFLQLIDEEDRNNMLQQIEQSRAKSQPTTTSYFWATRKDGERRYFKCLTWFSTNENGEELITGTTQDITQEHLLRQEAQQRAYLAEQVLEHNIDMIMVVDTQLRLTIWNKALEEAFGLSRNEVLGKKLTEVFPYLQDDLKLSLTKEALEGKEAIKRQVRFLKGQKFGEASYIPLRDGMGNIESVLIITHDITELKQTTERLKESNIRFEQAEQAGNLGSYLRNVDTGEVTASENMYHLFGVAPGSLTPTLDLFYEWVHPEDRQSTMEAIQRNMGAATTVPVRFRIIRKDGSIRYMKASTIPVLNEKGERVLYGSMLDTTEEELKNKALQDAYSFNQHITELAPNGIYVYDGIKSSAVFTNKKMRDLHGYSEEELKEMGPDLLHHIVHPDDLPQLYKNLQRFEKATDKDVIELHYRLRTKCGLYRHVICRESIFKRNEKGEPVQFIGVAVDVTDLKKAEKELNEKNKQLLQTNEELTSFNYVASHDLQEPLRKIQTFANFLGETEQGLTEQGRDSLKRMQMAAGRMRELINDLLSFSRIEMGKEELEQVDLNIVFKMAKSSLRSSINAKGATILTGELPVVQGVAFKMQQLFENLIGNAVKYCAPGVAPVVHITSHKVVAGKDAVEGLQPGAAYYHICFKDNGIGFEQQYADKIFELFQRLHTQNEYPGTGLGLAICKKIVQIHGGYILASSRPGEGAVFEIFLPTAEVLKAA